MAYTKTFGACPIPINQKNRKPIEVFYEVGFENLSHFSFAFKKQSGQTPSELASR